MIIRLIKHLRKVGWKQFKEEYKEKREEANQDPLTALNLQRTGYLGVIGFSLIASIAFFYKGLWYIGGLFLFNILIQYGMFITNRNQIKTFKEMKIEEQKQIERAESLIEA